MRNNEKEASEKTSSNDFLLVQIVHEIHQSQKTFTQVHILNGYILRHMNVYGGEIPDALDAICHQSVRYLLSHGVWYTDDADVCLIVFQELIHGVNVADFDVFHLHAYELGIHIKYSIEVESELLESCIICHSLTNISCTNDDGAVPFVQPQNGGNLIVKFFHIISISLLTETTEAVEVLTDLGSGESDLFTQFFRGNPVHIISQKLCQMSVVFW